MFSFFTKKEYLVDHLEGFIDIHNHILPGIDDGAKDVEESLKLIKGFGEFGVSDFICTPHIMENYFPNTPKTIKGSLELLQNSLRINDLSNVNIAAAAEHMIDAGFEKKLEDNKIMPLEESYLLIEMSYLQPSLNFENAIEKIQDMGLFPIIAHPERYAYLHHSPDKYKKIKDKGLLFQMNLLSLGDYYGKNVQSAGKSLLKNNLIDFFGTDIHSKTQLNQLKRIRLDTKTLNFVQRIIAKTIYNFK